MGVAGGPRWPAIDGGGRRVLVTGAGGLLGRKLLAAMTAMPSWTPLASARQGADLAGQVPCYPADLRDGPGVAQAIVDARPSVVIHSAAMTDVDGCERDPEAAWSINVGGTEHVAQAATAVGARLVYLSTEYVFDGQAGPYAEDDPTNPQGVYARTKRAGEERVAALCDRWTVARTTVLFGSTPGARPNFALWLIERLARGEAVCVVDDQIGSPTLADNLAEMLLALIQAEADGVFHTVGATRLSRYEFAVALAAAFGLQAALIEPIPTRLLGQPAPRPLRAGLLIDRYTRICPGVPPLPLGAALARFKTQLVEQGRWPLSRETS